MCCMSYSLQELKETEELDIQLRVFNENKEEDSIELSHRLDDIRAEMEYPFCSPSVCIYRWTGLQIYQWERSVYRGFGEALQAKAPSWVCSLEQDYRSLSTISSSISSQVY